MATDPHDTVWSADPHTLAKHQILRRYLQAWYPILTTGAGRENREVLFIDGFAGPGEYQGGEPGSPVIALNEAVGHSQSFSTPVHFVFIEKREDRFRRLATILAGLKPSLKDSPNVILDPVRHGDCNQELGELLDAYEKTGQHFGPALAFLDQFGYGAVSMALISRVMTWPQCEVFSFLNARDMNRWIPDLTKAPALDRAFGDDRWREALLTPEKDRRTHLLRLYEDALHELGGVRYVQTFRMLDRHNELLYWLLFCTNHRQGLYEMKRAMWAVDQKGGFHFSDRDDPRQTSLLADEYSQDWLADELVRRFKDQELTVDEIEEQVLTTTPCYKYKDALKRLERRDLLQVGRPDGARRGDFSNPAYLVKFYPARPRLF